MSDKDDDKEPEKKEYTMQELAEGFWESLGTEGKPVEVEQIKKMALERPITLEDIDYVISLRPFPDICNAALKQPPPLPIKPKIIPAEFEIRI